MRSTLAVSIASRSLAVVMLVGASWPSAVSAEPAETSPKPTFSELITQAKEQRAAERYADSARSFVAAYDVLSEEEQAGVRGEIAVSNAVDDFRRAQEQAPEEVVLLFQEAALLRRYESNRYRDGEMSPGLAEELVRVRALLEEVKQAQGSKTKTDAAEDPPPLGESVEPVEPELAPKPEPPKKIRDIPGLVLLGSGIAAAVGGVSLIGGGAWTFGVADEHRDEQLMALDAEEYPNEAGLRISLDQWYQRGRGIATGLVVGGAVLTGAGIGLATWGAVRLRKRGRDSRRRASVLVPKVSRHGMGVAAFVVF